MWRCAYVTCGVSAWDNNFENLTLVIIPLICRDSKWDKTTSGTVKIASDNGSVILEGTFDVHINWCNITWVATDTKYSTLLVHVHNGLSEPRTIVKVQLALISTHSRLVHTPG